MQSDEYIIEQLEINALSADDQADILDQVRLSIGEAVSAQLSEAQLEEYQEIIDANNKVIQPWLAKNIPDYKKSVVYEELLEGFKTDPEKNDPDKLFASLAWIELNVPNAKEVTDNVIADYKAKELSAS